MKRRSRAILSFAVVRSVKGNLTRTTSPGRALVGIEVGLVQPLSEARLAQAHPLPDLDPLGHFLEHDLELLRRKVAEQFCKLFRCDFDRYPGQ